MSITTQVLLTLFATLSPTGDSIFDLCDVVDERTGAPVYCEPSSEGAPVYDSTVCCDGRSCFAAPDGYCLADEEPLALSRPRPGVLRLSAKTTP